MIDDVLRDQSDQFWENRCVIYFIRNIICNLVIHVIQLLIIKREFFEALFDPFYQSVEQLFGDVPLFGDAPVFPVEVFGLAGMRVFSLNDVVFGIVMVEIEFPDAIISKSLFWFSIYITKNLFLKGFEVFTTKGN
jgi:hypothetical protein